MIGPTYMTSHAQAMTTSDLIQGPRSRDHCNTLDRWLGNTVPHITYCLDHGMLQSVENGRQIFHGCLWAAREVHHQHGPNESGISPRQGGKRCDFHGRRAHRLRNAWYLPLEYWAGGFWGYVAGGNASATGGERKQGAVCGGPIKESLLDKVDLVWNQFHRVEPVSLFLQKAGDGVAALVRTQASVGSIADNQQGYEKWVGRGFLLFTLCHETQGASLLCGKKPGGIAKTGSRILQVDIVGYKTDIRPCGV